MYVWTELIQTPGLSTRVLPLCVPGPSYIDFDCPPGNKIGDRKESPQVKFFTPTRSGCGASVGAPGVLTVRRSSLRFHPFALVTPLTCASGGPASCRRKPHHVPRPAKTGSPRGGGQVSCTQTPAAHPVARCATGDSGEADWHRVSSSSGRAARETYIRVCVGP